MAVTTEHLSDFFRIASSQGDAHSSSNYTLSAGFGSTASVTLSRANDQSGRVTIVCAGTGQGANPTCTIAYSQAWDRAPHMMLTRGGGSQATIIMSTTTENTTSAVLTFNGTAAGTEQYVFNYWTIG
jgi:hypothetical protein